MIDPSWQAIWVWIGMQCNFDPLSRGIGVQIWLCRTFGDAAYVAQIMRAWSMSIFPRPYIWRLTSLSLVIWPSV